MELSIFFSYFIFSGISTVNIRREDRGSFAGDEESGEREKNECSSTPCVRINNSGGCCGAMPCRPG